MVQGIKYLAGTINNAGANNGYGEPAMNYGNPMCYYYVWDTHFRISNDLFGSDSLSRSTNGYTWLQYNSWFSLISGSVQPTCLWWFGGGVGATQLLYIGGRVNDRPVIFSRNSSGTMALVCSYPSSVSSSLVVLSMTGNTDGTVEAMVWIPSATDNKIQVFKQSGTSMLAGGTYNIKNSISRPYCIPISTNPSGGAMGFILNDRSNNLKYTIGSYAGGIADFTTISTAGTYYVTDTKVAQNGNPSYGMTVYLIPVENSAGTTKYLLYLYSDFSGYISSPPKLTTNFIWKIREVDMYLARQELLTNNGEALAFDNTKKLVCIQLLCNKAILPIAYSNTTFRFVGYRLYGYEASGSKSLIFAPTLLNITRCMIGKKNISISIQQGSNLSIFQDQCIILYTNEASPTLVARARILDEDTESGLQRLLCTNLSGDLSAVPERLVSYTVFPGQLLSIFMVFSMFCYAPSSDGITTWQFGSSAYTHEIAAGGTIESLVSSIEAELADFFWVNPQGLCYMAYGATSTGLYHNTGLTILDEHMISERRKVPKPTSFTVIGAKGLIVTVNDSSGFTSESKTYHFPYVDNLTALTTIANTIKASMVSPVVTVRARIYNQGRLLPGYSILVNATDTLQWRICASLGSTRFYIRESEWNAEQDYCDVTCENLVQIYQPEQEQRQQQQTQKALLENKPIWCDVVKNANTNINNTTDTKVPFELVIKDLYGCWSTANNRFTAPVSGIYSISVAIVWASNATGTRGTFIKRNGLTGANLDAFASYDHRPALSGALTRFGYALNMYLVRGDYIEVWVWQNSGGVLAVTNYTAGAANETRLKIALIGEERELV